MIDYKLSEVSKICSNHVNDCKHCPFYLRNWHGCWFSLVDPSDFYQEGEEDSK